MSKTINFYRTSGPYGCFSNFSKHSVLVAGKRWPTSEHYFQAQKFPGTEIEELIRHAPSAGIAANMGRSRDHPLRPDWEEVKDAVMYDVVLAKFSQHEALRDVLLGTGDATLVEHTANDSYWGDGSDGTGKNMLGQILMKVRNELAGRTV